MDKDKKINDLEDGLRVARTILGALVNIYGTNGVLFIEQKLIDTLNKNGTLIVHKDDLNNFIVLTYHDSKVNS